MKQISVYIMAHKKFDVPENEIYKPLQVGSALHDKIGYIADDSGENISAKNPYYNELTGLYWMWKNDKESDVMGLCHYRRYFLDKDGALLGAEQINDILSAYDAIVSGRLVYREGNVMESYIDKHHEQDLTLTRAAIEKLYPAYLADYDSVMNGRETYFGNLMIAKSRVVKEYAAWLFDILFEVEKHIDLSEYDDYDKRVYGFIAERLLTVWLRHNRLKIYENTVGLVGEKSESGELAKKAVLLLEAGKAQEAMEQMEEANKARPDLFFKDSDTTGELKRVYMITGISLLEKRRGEKNILEYAPEYDRIAAHYDAIYRVLDQAGYGNADMKYLIENQVSTAAILTVMSSIEYTDPERINVYNNLANAYLNEKDLRRACIFVEFALKQEQEQ
ncbi:MAG: DUF4422 domain-containing protein [Alistipes sp.]|nr:DUF4422 domain-containing protein [Alistipes sp.]